jgi:DMSO/TMAO reductase YedYZ molybdopterin-dependent catalytic subunit
MDLPPGQYAMSAFPRFGLLPFAGRFPKETGTARLRINGEVEREMTIEAPFGDLPRVEQSSDFHCVTTWSCRALRWSGVRFADAFERVVRSEARPSLEAGLVVLRGQDGYRAILPLADLLAPDVLLADSLDGRPLTIAHGAPLRLVAPAHYGYKSVKHLHALEFRRDDRGYRPSGFRFMEHPRARVAMEERGRVLPGSLFRHLYRPFIGLTIRRFREALAPDEA